MKNLYAKLHAIMSEVDYIQKDKTNTHHNYRYASEKAIKEKLHSAFVSHGVLFFLSVTDVSNESVTTSNGNTEARTTAKMQYSFTDIESGEQFVGYFYGSGNDAGDKGLYKAITGAIKYILTSTFIIPTGDDPEEDDDDCNSASERTAEKPVKVTYDESSETGSKVCPKCGKTHRGKYPKCLACWQADKK
ncbi:MAG: ERF family protein [Patescibacteria group bacterium]